MEDFDLIRSSFQSQYGIRLSKDLAGMKWDEFRALLVGVSPDTALGRIVAIRSEDDKAILKNFTKDQHRIRNEWRKRQAAHVSEAELNDVLDGFKKAFLALSK